MAAQSSARPSCVAQAQAVPGQAHQHVGAGSRGGANLGLRIAAIGQIDGAGLRRQPIKPLALIQARQTGVGHAARHRVESQMQRHACLPGPSMRLESTMRIGRVGAEGALAGGGALARQNVAANVGSHARPAQSVEKSDVRDLANPRRPPPPPSFATTVRPAHTSKPTATNPRRAELHAP